MDAAMMLEGMEKIFQIHFREFNLRIEKDEFIFSRRYEHKNLTIEVRTSILDGGLFGKKFNERKKILFVVLHGNKPCLTIRPSRIMANWQGVLKDKIIALVDAVGDIPRCKQCGVYYFPTQSTTFKQGNPKGTKFVWFNCPKCHNKIFSTYGVGIKTRLHKYLE